MNKRYLFFFFLLICSVAVANAPEPGLNYTFIQNKGQWAQPVLYTTELPQGWLFLEKSGFTYNFREPGYFNPEASITEENQRTKKFRGHAFQVKFIGANSQSTVSSANQQPGYRNYFIGSNASHWATNVPSFTNIRYNQVYPGIDLHLYTAGNQLKYDYILAPQASPATIQMRYEGVQNLALKNGKLYIQTSVNEFMEESPYAYQEINGKKHEVACQFTLQYNTVGFSITGPYNPAIPLFIDPQLVFATYTGTLTSVSANCATADAAGYTYTGVHALEPSYPTTNGAYQTLFKGANIAISKFNEQGTNLLFGTYIGGSGMDYPLSLVVNNQNELLILGTSNSENFPTLENSYDKNLGNNLGSFTSDYVIAKLSSTGDNLLAATYLGGSGTEGASFSAQPAGLTNDKTGNIYVGVNTNSTDFPVANGFQVRFGGASDAAVVKLNNTLSQIIWSSYLGGTLNEYITDIKVGIADQIYVSGATYSSNFPTTASVHSRQLGGFKDGFISVISPGGNELQASSYVGTNSNDLVQLLELDSEENIYAIGYTTGRYPVTDGTYTTPNTNGGYFIHKINSSLTTTAFTTHIGNHTIINPTIEYIPTAFRVDDCGRIYFSAYAVSDCPLTTDAFQAERRSLYFAQLSKDAKALEYGTYLGGMNFNHIHYANKSTITEAGFLHHIECTSLADYPLLPNAYSIKRSGDLFDGAVMRFELSKPLSSRIKAAVETPAYTCAPATITFTNRSENALNYSWNFGDGSAPSTETNPQHTFQQAGTYKVLLTASNPDGCTPEETTEVEVTLGARFAAPNIITPNNDGKNDAFVIQNLIPGTKLKIYNRWGQLVYQIDDYQNNWQAAQVVKGTYYFTAENPEACPPVIKGWVEVVQ